MTENQVDLANRQREEWFGGGVALEFHNRLRADYERYIDDFRDVLTKQMLEAAGYSADDKADEKTLAAANTFVMADAVLAAIAMFEARDATRVP
jgi:hypothetical protein